MPLWVWFAIALALLIVGEIGFDWYWRRRRARLMATMARRGPPGTHSDDPPLTVSDLRRAREDLARAGVVGELRIDPASILTPDVRPFTAPETDFLERAIAEGRVEMSRHHISIVPPLTASHVTELPPEHESHHDSDSGGFSDSSFNSDADFGDD